MKSIKLNDASYAFSGESLGDLLRHLESPKEGVAVAVNGEIVPKSRLETTLLRHKDDVVIFESIAGG